MLKHAAPPRLSVLPYRKPTEGRDYWLLDDALSDPMALRNRSLARTDWIEGYPRRPESWPGLRIVPALQPEEIAPAYVFLAAPSCSSYIPGEILPINGGYSGG